MRSEDPDQAAINIASLKTFEVTALVKNMRLERNYRAAITACNDWIDANGEHPALLAELTLTLLKSAGATGNQDDLTQAEIWAKKAITANPKNLFPQVVLAEILAKLGHDDAAITLLREIIAKDPNEKIKLARTLLFNIQHRQQSKSA